MLARVALSLFFAAPLCAQSVTAAGQPPAVPGRFGFSLECVQGCSWVEAGIDHAYFRHKGEPRVSAVLKGSSAQRAGLRVGDVLVEVDSEAVASDHAGLALASDTLELLILGVRDAKGKERTVRLWSPRRCDGPRGVIVSNHSGDDVRVYMSTRRRNRLLSQVGPGVYELAVPGNDSTYRADQAYFYGRPTTQRQNTNAWPQLVLFKVVCHE